MQSCHEQFGDVERYIESHRHIKIDDKKADFEYIFSIISKFKCIDHNSRILEIGTGIGWFPILCTMGGIFCKGLEISQALVEYSRQFGRQHSIEPDIEWGNIEEANIGISAYDVIIAGSVFEHVENWQKGLKRVFTALKPGGILYFYSTNKFSFISGEYNFPLYGWLPDNWRYRLRKARQGEDIMKLGIDFNQFTYFQLRQFFKNLGFSKVLDRVEVLNFNATNGFCTINKKRIWKAITLSVLNDLKPLKHLFLFFSNGTFFVCIK